MTLNFQLFNEKLTLFEMFRELFLLQLVTWKSNTFLHLFFAGAGLLCLCAIKGWCLSFFSFLDLITICLDFLPDSILTSMLLSSLSLFFFSATGLFPVLYLTCHELPLLSHTACFALSTVLYFCLLTGLRSLPDNPPHLNSSENNKYLVSQGTSLYLSPSAFLASRCWFFHLLLDFHIKSLLRSSLVV